MRNRKVGHSVQRCKIHENGTERAIFLDQTTSCAGRTGNHQFVSRITLTVETSTDHTQTGVIGNKTRIGPVLEVLIKVQFGRYGIEIKIDSLAGDGSKSWVVISRGVERFVTELSPDCTEPMNVDTTTLGPGQPDAFLSWQAQRTTTSKEKDEHIPINQRNWGHIFGVDKVLSSCFPISKKMSQLLRHFQRHREEDGAVPWRQLMKHFQGFRDRVSTWTFEDWQDCVKYGTDKIRFEYCLDQHGRITYWRSIQDHSGGVRVDPTLRTNVNIPHGWTDYIYHVGSALDYRSEKRHRQNTIREVLESVWPNEISTSSSR